MTIKFHPKRPAEQQTALFTFFKKNGQKITLYPKRIIQTAYWSPSKQICLSKHPAANEINNYLKTWREQLEKIILNLETSGQFVCKEIVQSKLDEFFSPKPIDSDKAKDFTEFMDWYISTKKTAKRHVQKLEQTKKLIFICFGLITKKALADWNAMNSKGKSKCILTANKKLPFSEINLDFIVKFREFLYEVKINPVVRDGITVLENYKINYIDRQVKGLKQFILEAQEQKLIEQFGWSKIKTEEREVDSIYCDFEELGKIADVELTNPAEQKVRDLCIFNSNLGMRYSDLKKVEPHLFRHTVIGVQVFIGYSFRQTKTDDKVEFVLPPICADILQKYEFNLPKYSAKEFNEVIKRVAFKAGLTQLVRIREYRGHNRIERDVPKYQLMSSHTMRRSFCTNCYEAGMPIQAIQSISGHTTEEEFRKYIKKASVKLETVAGHIMSIPGMQSRQKEKAA